jgi:hypothetical protein
MVLSELLSNSLHENQELFVRSGKMLPLLILLFAISGVGLLADSTTEIPVAELINQGSTDCFNRNVADRTFGPENIQGPPCWIRTPNEYGDFRMSFEIRLNAWAEAMLILRAPKTGRPSKTGVAIVFAHDFHGITTNFVTGAVAGRIPPLMPPRDRFGIWHQVEVSLIQQDLVVRMDGEDLQRTRVADADSASWAEPKGFIGFSNLNHFYTIRSLNIQPVADVALRSFPVEEKMLQRVDGWLETGEKELWSPDAETITAKTGNGIVYAPGEFADFEFFADFRTEGRMNAGLFFRAEPSRGERLTKENRGFEVQIYSPVDAVFPTGSIYGTVRADLREDLENQWSRIRVRVQGKRVRVWVNGEAVASGEIPSFSTATKGRIGLQVHSPAWGLISFRNMRLMELVDTKPH